MAVRHRHGRIRAERVGRARLQHTAVDVGRSAIGVNSRKDGGAGEHVDRARAADRRRKHIVARRVVEIERAGAHSKCHACRVERAWRNRRTAGAGADIQCSNRTSVRGDHNRPADDAAIGDCERARARVANKITPELLLQVEPGPVTAPTLRTCSIADVGGEGGVIDNRATVRDRECARAKTADIEPAAWTVVPTGARLVTITVPVEPTANPTEPPPALFTVPPSRMMSVPAPWPPTTTFEAFVHVEPAPDTVTVPCEPGKLPTNPPKSVNGNCPGRC